MGYVTVTETAGEITKTYHFEYYDDFKDWKNKISGTVIRSEEEIFVETDVWIQNNGIKPLHTNDTLVEVMFRNTSKSQDYVGSLLWGLNNKHYDIIKYRVVSK